MNHTSKEFTETGASNDLKGCDVMGCQQTDSEFLPIGYANNVYILFALLKLSYLRKHAALGSAWSKVIKIKDTGFYLPEKNVLYTLYLCKYYFNGETICLSHYTNVVMSRKTSIVMQG